MCLPAARLTLPPFRYASILTNTTFERHRLHILCLVSLHETLEKHSPRMQARCISPTVLRCEVPPGPLISKDTPCARVRIRVEVPSRLSIRSYRSSTTVPPNRDDGDGMFEYRNDSYPSSRSLAVRNGLGCTLVLDPFFMVPEGPPCIMATLGSLFLPRHLVGLRLRQRVENPHSQALLAVVGLRCCVVFYRVLRIDHVLSEKNRNLISPVL